MLRNKALTNCPINLLLRLPINRQFIFTHMTTSSLAATVLRQQCSSGARQKL
jgi:hypothetical protein